MHFPPPPHVAFFFPRSFFRTKSRTSTEAQYMYICPGNLSSESKRLKFVIIADNDSDKVSQNVKRKIKRSKQKDTSCNLCTAQQPPQPQDTHTHTHTPQSDKISHRASTQNCRMDRHVYGIYSTDHSSDRDKSRRFPFIPSALTPTCTSWLDPVRPRAIKRGASSSGLRCTP